MEIFGKYITAIKKLVENEDKITIRVFGHGASGKSTFTKMLVEQVNPEKVNLLETDPYIISGNYRDLVQSKINPNQKVTASMPVSHELNSLKRDILALQQGLDILTIEEPWCKSVILNAEKPILIVEGMSSAFLPKEIFDLSICLKTSSETELERRTIRDTKERGQNLELIRKTHESRREQYNYFYQPFEKDADILIKT
ncbi:uridine kinase family protein [Streptococcus parauberis]|uniref:Phosphoribulokinase/uridine kinase family protein n=1 Tax=Streptococcus parauberis NCFD 2020 TaxID=873447 RepID=F1Z2K6_9STRE|nr:MULTISPECIES: phosphoribulokinase [Streptococcus]EGE53799.1 phosphoribulokinase/uridine kinase family protein [Streptococcus parauberis NCFD 2020]QGG98477.1 phosphoribulokinase [Streptococcus dysgalactiae subsp. dysgalactiae]